MAAKSIQVVLLVETEEYGLTQSFMSDLNSLLKQAQSISFKDEPEHTYYVEFEGAEDTDEQLKQEVTLNFLWHDPYKYMPERTINYTNAHRLTIDSAEPVEPYIELEFETGIKAWSMRNTTTNMNINYEYELVANVYQIDVAEQYLTKSVNRVNAMDGLTTESDFEDFIIKQNDQIVVTPTPSRITIRYRGVSL